MNKALSRGLSRSPEKPATTAARAAPAGRRFFEWCRRRRNRLHPRGRREIARRNLVIAGAGQLAPAIRGPLSVVLARCAFGAPILALVVYAIIDQGRGRAHLACGSLRVFDDGRRKSRSHT